MAVLEFQGSTGPSKSDIIGDIFYGVSPFGGWHPFTLRTNNVLARAVVADHYCDLIHNLKIVNAGSRDPHRNIFNLVLEAQDRTRYTGTYDCHTRKSVLLTDSPWEQVSLRKPLRPTFPPDVVTFRLESIGLRKLAEIGATLPAPDSRGWQTTTYADLRPLLDTLTKEDFFLLSYFRRPA